MHGLGNVVVLIMFAASWWLRYENSDMHTLQYILSFAAAGLAGVTGWLGGELIDRLGVGIDDGAHLDAPNSLTGKSASENVN